MTGLRRFRVLAVVGTLLAAALGLAAPPAAAAPAGGHTVVGSFVDWGVYQRDYRVKNIDTSGSAAKLTHLDYAFGNATNGTSAVGDSAGRSSGNSPATRPTASRSPPSRMVSADTASARESLGSRAEEVWDG